MLGEPDSIIEFTWLFVRHDDITYGYTGQVPLKLKFASVLMYPKKKLI